MAKKEKKVVEKKPKKVKEPKAEKVEPKLPETPERKALEISKEVAKVEKQSQSIVVATREDYEKATQFLVTIVKPRMNRIEDLTKFFTDPYLEQRRVALAKKQEIEDLFGRQLKPFQEIEAKVKRQMANFIMAEERKAREEEAKLLQEREKQNAKLEQKGKEPIAEPVQMVERPQQTIKMEEGKSTAKKEWRFEIVDYKALPHAVLAAVLEEAEKTGLTEKVVRKQVQAGVREMTGVRIYEDVNINISAR